MVGIAFHFRDPQPNFFVGILDLALDRIILNARNLGATHLFMIDQTQYRIGQYYQHSDSQIAFGRTETLEALELEYSGTPFVYFENESRLRAAGIQPTLLPDFVHPASAIYVFGSDSGGLPIVGRESKLWVSIPVESIWAEGALNICLYDRLIKAA